MGKAHIVIHLKHHQLLTQAVLALAPRADPSPHRGDMLADAEVDPLHEGGVDVPAMWSQHGMMASSVPNTTR